MKPVYFIAVLIVVAVLAFFIWTSGAEAPTVTDDPSSYYTNASADLIVPSSPLPNAAVVSPLAISGKARGTWYFEATFPVTLVDWDGRIIAESYAEAQSEWMTEEFVPFKANLPFVAPECAPGLEYCARGTLILQKDNPSGLSEHDAALEIPIRFR